MSPKLAETIRQAETLGSAIAELEGVEPWEVDAVRGLLNAAVRFLQTRSSTGLIDDVSEVGKAVLDAKKFGAP